MSPRLLDKLEDGGLGSVVTRRLRSCMVFGNYRGLTTMYTDT